MFDPDCTYIQLSTIRNVVRFAFECNNLDYDHYDITIKYSNRLTTTLGRADSNHVMHVHSIKLGAKLWERATLIDRYETIIHEACHLVDFIKRPGRYKSLQGHDEPWQLAMHNCGVEPERYHNIDTSGIRRKNSKTKAFCACKIWNITTNRATRIKNGSNYRCPTCRHILSLRRRD